MIFKKKRNGEPLEFIMRNQIIPYKERIQFLQIALDSQLNREEQITKIKVKAKRTLNNIWS